VFEHDPSIEDISPDISIALFRIFQETLANITKHAQANEVVVLMHDRDGIIELKVLDNGRGFTEADRAKPRSFGLRGIRERVEYFGGRVKIESALGQGTQIGVYIPREAGLTSTDDPLSQQNLF
jgi:signal transduction histidine kinase